MTRPVKPLNGNRLRTGEILTGYLLIIPMYQWGIVAFMQRFLGLMAQHFPWMFTSAGVLNSWWNFIYYILLTALLLSVFHRFIREEWKLFRDHIHSCLHNWFGYFLLCLVGNILGSMLVALLITPQENPNQQAINSALEAAVVPMLMGAILLGPLCEEILFRGLIFRSLRRINIPLAHILSAAAFAMVHLLNELIETGDLMLIPMTLPYFFMGLGLSISYERKHTLIIPLTIHMAVNLIAVIL